MLALLFWLAPNAVFAADGVGRHVIIDTDIDSDVDDVQALAMAHRLADAGRFVLSGIVVTSDDPFAATCVSAINQHFGRPDLPVGFLKGQPALKNHSRYTRQVSEEFPHRLRSHEDASDSTDLYRRLLAGSPDESVVIVTIGHLTSLQALLRSSADRHSPLNGRELVRQKAQRWLCMGGQFPRGKEANFYRPDPASTVTCLREWPGAATFCGWEVGNLIQTGGEYLKSSLPAQSPVYRAYQLYNNFKGRASWDQVAVFMLLPEAEQYFDRIANGYCHVSPDGSNEWRTDARQPHEYVALKPGASAQAIARRMDDLSRTRD